MDTEFNELMNEVNNSNDFQTVLRAHKKFISSVVRMSYIDNTIVQDSIERILQICLRFLSVSDLYRRNEELSTSLGSSSSGMDEILYLPSEELEAIQKDFFLQVSYLLQLMKKIENRGFVFRLDFNGYLSLVASKTINPK